MRPPTDSHFPSGRPQFEPRARDDLGPRLPFAREVLASRA